MDVVTVPLTLASRTVVTRCRHQISIFVECVLYLYVHRAPLTLASRAVVIAHGTLETPEFQRQNREFANTLRERGKRVEFLVGQGYNHYEMFETLGNPYGLLGRAMLALINL